MHMKHPGTTADLLVGTYLDPQALGAGFFDAFFSDPGMQGSLLNGIFSTVDPIAPVCPSGNCIWDSFSSLGVCSICENITASVSRGKCDPMGQRFDMWETESSLSVGATQLCKGDSDSRATTTDAYVGAISNHTVINSTAMTAAPDKNPVIAGRTKDLPAPPGIDLLTEVLLFRKAGMSLSVSQSYGGWLPYSGNPEVHACRLKWCMRSWSDVKVVSFLTRMIQMTGFYLTRLRDRPTEV